jgi:hypothetical protein
VVIFVCFWAKFDMLFLLQRKTKLAPRGAPEHKLDAKAPIWFVSLVSFAYF